MSKEHYVRDSWNVSFVVMKVHMDRWMAMNGCPQPVQRLGKRWRIRVGGLAYPEMWLRHYALFRQMHGCTVMASDWANRMTDLNKPIVRDPDFDLELLLAHARMQQRTKETVRKREGVSLYAV